MSVYNRKKQKWRVTMFEKSIEITYATLTDRGERVQNEDSLGVEQYKDGIMFILCDGLGGHGKGDVASNFIVKTILDMVCRRGMNTETAIMKSQNELLEKQKRENAQNSMKTTLTCLNIAGERARYIHVGDSRVYHFEGGKLKDRTFDHSVPQMLVNIGEIKEFEIRHHEDRSRLLRVVGSEWDTPKYQVGNIIKIGRKTTFLMCSDGFWELIDEKEMCRTLKKSKTPQEWLNEMQKIVLSNGKGSDMDNYSAIAVFIR